MSAPKLGDFSLGVIELFSVLLPGGLLMAALALAAPLSLTGFLGPLLATREAQWVGFVFGAYGLGALIFLPASRLDALLYDPYRKWRWPKADDRAYDKATALRARVFPGPTATDDPMNTFAWSKALLLLHAPAAFSEVERFEAESKFFRSLIIALPLAALLLLTLTPMQWVELPAALVLAALSFFRYAERRHKSTEWAYRYVIALQMAPAALSPKALAAVAA